MSKPLTAEERAVVDMMERETASTIKDDPKTAYDSLCSAFASVLVTFISAASELGPHAVDILGEQRTRHLDALVTVLTDTDGEVTLEHRMGMPEGGFEL